MSELISGKEALIALANGEDVQIFNGSIWLNVEGDYQVDVFLKTERKFRLKPRTITINGIEVPAPFEPKEGEGCYFLCDEDIKGYKKATSLQKDNWDFNFGAWRTKEEIKQVVAALRSVFGAKEPVRRMSSDSE